VSVGSTELTKERRCRLRRRRERGPLSILELETPFPTVDLDAVDRNVARMQAYCDEHGLALRPHVKTHKLPRIARLQLDAGARGLTCQKLGEAELMADAGFDDILITFPLIGTGKAERLAELAARANVTVGADSADVAVSLSHALEQRGAEIGFLVDCDTGFARTGVQSPAEAASLADLVDRLPGLRLAGLMTHPATAESGPMLAEARAEIERRGLAVERISGGGTPEAYRVHESGVFTELRVGTYVYGDRRCLALGVTPLEDCALRVVATVVSRPTRDHAVLDAGSKTLTSDTLPALEAGTFGLVVEYPDAVIRRLSEEHADVDLSASDPFPEIGDVVTIVPNHACGTVNMHDEIALHRGGRDVEIVAVEGRGLVR
jgi:D-serine deaminase-like pyridoxal phosphate-dependent protein